MEKRKFSGKTILKLSGALLALAYFGFCLYAGITGLSSFLCKFLKKYFGEGVLPDLILRYSFELIC